MNTEAQSSEDNARPYAEDLDMLKYYWIEKQDLTSWCDWSKRRTVIREFYPEIYDAWERYRSALRTMDVLIENL